MDPENPYGFRCKLCAQKDQTIEIQARYIANLEKQLGLDSENITRTGILKIVINNLKINEASH